MADQTDPLPESAYENLPRTEFFSRLEKRLEGGAELGSS